MFEYVDASGQIYTEDQINKMAAEQKTSANAIISNKGLKKKSSTASSAQKQAKKTYPWSNQESKKEEPGFLDNFKKSLQKQKVAKAAVAEKPTAPMSSAQSQVFLDELTSSLYQQQSPKPFSMETETFQKAKAKKAEEKKVVETADFKLFQKQAAALDLKKDREASKWVEDGLIASKVTEEELNEIDSYIDSEKKKFGQKIITPGRISRDGIQTTPERTEIYQPFATEVAKIKKELASKKLLNKFDDKKILDFAAEDYKKNEIAKRKQDKFTDYLENTTDISDKSKKLADNYFEKTKAAEAASYAKDTMIRDEKENQISDISNKINTLLKSIKPAGYKFKMQEEIGAENKKIAQLNELIKIYELENINYRNLNKKIDKTSANYDDVSFQQDLYKRDYSWVGQADKLKTRSVQWAYELLGGMNYMSAGTAYAPVYDYLRIKELTGIENPFSAYSEFLADRVDALSTDLQGLYPKQRELASAEGTFEKAGDLLINQAPDLILMALTRGGSTAAKLAKEAPKASLLKRTGSYLTLNKQTGLIATRGAGSKYLNMISQEKNGYYDENGDFVKPDYNLVEVLVAPALYGYAEGVFEKSTGKILEKGKGFFKAASKAEPDEWFDYIFQTTNKLIKKAGGNFLEAQVEEQLSEQLTNVVQNGVDKFILGKDVNLLDNAAEVGQDTALLTTVLAGAPILGGAAIRPFMSNSTASKAFDNSRAMAAILHELEFNKDLSEIQKTALQKKLSNLKDNTSIIFSSTVNNMAEMSPKAFNAMNDTATEIATIMAKAKEVDASDSASKDADLAELKKDFIKAKVKLDRLAVATESVKTFGKPISVVAKANLIDLAAQRVEVGFNDTLSEEERKAVYDSIEIETEKVYKNEGISLKEERVKEFEQNLKAAQKLAKDTDTKIIIANKSESIEKTINNLNKSGKLLGEITADQILEAKSSDGFIIDGKAGESFIIINREAALKAKAVTVASHEFLHKLLSKTLSNSNSQIALGQSLSDYLLSNSPELYLNEKVIGRLQNNYGNYDQGTQMEELLTVFSDAIASGNIKYKETFFTKIGDQIRRLLQDFGLVNIEFNSGRDVFNFIRDYNNTIAKGKELNKAQKRLLEKGAKGKLVSKEGGTPVSGLKQSKSIEQRMDELEEQLNDNEIDIDDYERKMKALEKEEAELKSKSIDETKVENKPAAKKEIAVVDPEAEVKEIIKDSKEAVSSDKVQKIYEEKGLDGAFDIIKLFAPITKKIVDKRRDAPGFDRDLLTSEIETGEGGILYLIKDYDASKGVPLAAYINKFLPVRAITASRRVLDKDFSKDASEEKGLMATETADSGFTEAAKEKPKYKNALESNILSPEELKTAENKILTVVRTLKNRIDAPISINRTVTPVIAEIRDAMGKQLDIDLKTMMGGKKDGVLRKWLLDNKRYVLENMTTTWLMGADGKGGIPQAIQKRIDGRWVNYPDWVGQKIDRESVSTDLAGRTSGAELARRLPNVFNNVSNEDYLGQILGPDGNPIRGRKESLAKAVAEELAFDIINNDLANEGPIFEALATNQERLGYELLNNFAVTFQVASDRGNVKYSKTVREAMADLTNLPESVKTKIIGADGNTFINYTRGLVSSDDAELKFHEYYSIDEFSAKEKVSILNSVKALYNYYKKADSKKITLGPKDNESFDQYANRRIFKALSYDQSNAVILDVRPDSLSFKKKDSKKAAQNAMKAFHKEFLLYTTKVGEMTKVNNNKLFTKLFSRGFAYGEGQSLFGRQEGFFNAFLKNYKGFSLTTIGSGKTITYKGDKVNMELGNLAQDRSSEDISKFIKTGDISSIDYEGRKKLSNGARSDVEKMIRILKGMHDNGAVTNIQLGIIFKTLGSSMVSPLKIAAELRYVADTKGYSKDSKEWVYEHQPPTSYISRLALGVITGQSEMNVDEFMEKVINNSYVAIIPKEVDNVVNSLYQSTMPFSYKPGDNPLIRYFDVGFNGANIPAMTDLSNNKPISKEILKDEFFPDIANKTQNAVIKASKSQEPKGISVFDFDDTVGLTKSNVLYTMPNETTIYHGGTIKGLKDISGPLYVATDKDQAEEYSKGNKGVVKSFVIKTNEIVNEDIVIDEINALGLKSKDKNYEVNELNLYELIDPNFDTSLSNKDLNTLFNSLKRKGIKAVEFLDMNLVTLKNNIYNIVILDKNIVQEPGKLTGEEFAKEGTRLLEEGAEFDFSEFSKVVDGKPGPMVEKMKKMLGKFGPENFFILTARPPAAAVPIHEFLSSIGIDIPLENITGLGNSKAQAKADWMVDKANEGYNDFYFSDDAIQNVEAVKNALDVLDVKSKIQQAKIKFSRTMSETFNQIIEDNKGVEHYKVYSDIVAKRRGAGKNKFDLFVPPSAADFELLLYKFLGKGELGEEQRRFFDEALLKPYINGVNLMDGARQSIKGSYKALTKAFPNVQKKLEKLSPDKDFTYDQAIRVAMWNDGGVKIPGLTERDNRKLVDMVNSDPELLAFKEGLKAMSRQEKGWPEPSDYWDTDTIVSDLFNITQASGRKQFLSEFVENVDNIFGKWENGKLVGPNMNKIQAVYGTNVREALEDSLYRMINGKNRSYGQDKETSAWSNWVNGSTGVIMFLNTRSAVLQLISTANFLNLRDNNPLAAAAAFANQKQYWKDFATIWNSDKMKERRGGLREDVAAAEIANSAAGSKNKAAAVMSYLLKVGYTPTQMADSFAIASGGAPFYRNRVKTHIKEGMELAEAEALAWEEFSKVADETQQSGDPKDISKQQSSGAGRLLLTFQNTAMQQSRLVKKSFLDLKNGRGDAKTHIAKISYYLLIQNTIFSVLQQGLFALMFDSDEEEEEKIKKQQEKAVDLANNVLDSILRGTGFAGGVVSVLKNVTLKYLEEKEKDYQADYAKVILEGANISPPIGSKLRKAYTALKQTQYDKDLIKERGWSIMQDGRVHLGPNYQIAGKASEVLLNVPLDRAFTKIENVSQALNNEHKAWQRVSVGLGFNPYSVGIGDTPGDKKIIEEAKSERKEEGIIKAIETRARKKKERKAALKAMTPMERESFFIKEQKEKSKKSNVMRKILKDMTPMEREIYYNTGVMPKNKKRKMGGD